MAAAQDLWVHETLDNGRDCPRDSEDGEPDADREEVSHPVTLEGSNQEATVKQNRQYDSCHIVACFFDDKLDTSRHVNPRKGLEGSCSCLKY